LIDFHLEADPDSLDDTTMNTIDTAFDTFVSKITDSGYDNQPNFIFEVWNENSNASGNGTKYKSVLQTSYTSLRSVTPNLILLGSYAWNQHPDVTALWFEQQNPGQNVAYTFHIYAGTHAVGNTTDPNSMGNQITRSRNYPVFMSEWGMTSANGSGGIFEANTQAWWNLMKDNYISSCLWSFANVFADPWIPNSSILIPSNPYHDVNVLPVQQWDKVKLSMNSNNTVVLPTSYMDTVVNSCGFAYFAISQGQDISKNSVLQYGTAAILYPAWRVQSYAGTATSGTEFTISTLDKYTSLNKFKLALYDPSVSTVAEGTALAVSFNMNYDVNPNSPFVYLLGSMASDYTSMVASYVDTVSN
jgi:hypothetical protein